MVLVKSLAPEADLIEMVHGWFGVPPGHCAVPVYT
jgi:hypothetical protein